MSVSANDTDGQDFFGIGSNEYDPEYSSLIEKSSWVPDSASNYCELCARKWSLSRRRHHCRHCGHLVCKGCSSKTIKDERFCDLCFIIHKIVHAKIYELKAHVQALNELYFSMTLNGETDVSMRIEAVKYLMSTLKYDDARMALLTAAGKAIAALTSDFSAEDAHLQQYALGAVANLTWTANETIKEAVVRAGTVEKLVQVMPGLVSSNSKTYGRAICFHLSLIGSGCAEMAKGGADNMLIEQWDDPEDVRTAATLLNLHVYCRNTEFSLATTSTAHLQKVARFLKASETTTDVIQDLESILKDPKADVQGRTQTIGGTVSAGASSSASSSSSSSSTTTTSTSNSASNGTSDAGAKAVNKNLSVGDQGRERAESMPPPPPSDSDSDEDEEEEGAGPPPPPMDDDDDDSDDDDDLDNAEYQSEIDKQLSGQMTADMFQRYRAASVVASKSQDGKHDDDEDDVPEPPSDDEEDDAPPPPPEDESGASASSSSSSSSSGKNQVLGDLTPLLRGAFFTKFGRKGSPHKRFVWLSEDQEYVCWAKTDKEKDNKVNTKNAIAVSSMQAVLAGRETDIFKSNKKKKDPAKKDDWCFSVVGTERTLDLEVLSQTTAVRDYWVNLFETLMNAQ